MRLSANSKGENYLTILVPTVGGLNEVNEALCTRALGLRNGLRQNTIGVRTLRYGTWRRFHLEVAAAPAAIEILGWKLTPKEQRLMDALEAYGKQGAGAGAQGGLTPSCDRTDASEAARR